jgi:glycogen debranching enzyme
MLSVVDIVLNHTAFNSEWICKHPDACYNTDDCPHLWSAWLLDKGIRDFSNAYAHKKVPELPSAPFISNESDLGKVMHHIKTKIYEPLKLYEFFLCNVD